MDDDMKAAIKEYLKENLSVEVDVGESYSYNGSRVKVSLLLDGEVFSNWSDSLPSD